METALLQKAATDYKLVIQSVTPISTLYNSNVGYRLETKEGTKVLKEFRGSLHEICFVTKFMRELAHFGCNVLKPIRTIDGKLFWEYKYRLFYLTDWFPGASFDATQSEEVKLISQAIATMHVMSKQLSIFSFFQSKNSQTIKQFKQIYVQHRLFLSRIEKLKNKQDNEVCKLLVSHATMFSEQSKQAIEILRTLDAEKINRIVKKQCQFVHRDLTRPNLLLDKKKPCILDFDRSCKSLQSLDVAAFLINTLNYSSMQGANAWEQYLQINPLNKTDRKITVVAMKLPREAWEIARLCMKKNPIQDQKIIKRISDVVEKQTQKAQFIRFLQHEFC